MNTHQILSSPGTMSNTVTEFPYSGGRFQVNEDGVFFVGADRDGNEQLPKWICSPLRIAAKTRDEHNGEWGRLLEWHDDDGKLHRWAMPLEMLEGDGVDVRRELARLGLHISTKQAERALLAAYIKVFPVQTRARCVERLGWHGEVFVTPSRPIGDSDELKVFQNAHTVEPAYSVSGTIEEWRDSVAALAQGNSRLTFAIATAFAGALAEITNEDSGGFHFRGESSSGKSTALKVAASVWGHPSRYVRLWRSTVNGLEGLAALHNDGLLILDEISQMDPAAVGEAAYMLANGQGKVRAQRNGMPRSPQRWRLLFLSAGEESLSSLMSRAGTRTNAGQEIRLADVEADAGAGMGVFEELHGRQSAGAIAVEVKEASDNFHGAVGLAWLEHIAEKRSEVSAYLFEAITRFLGDAVPANAVGQVERVARRFALVASAGELASEFGLTGWGSGEATRGALECFNAWLEAFGAKGNREARVIVAQARAFFETHGKSRFEDMKATNEQRVPNRAGFFRMAANGQREFLVLPGAFRSEICQGFYEKTAKRALIEAGMLLPSKEGPPSQNVRVPELGSIKVYVFRYTGE